MGSQDDWCFDFFVHAADPIPRRMIDDLLCDTAIGWAEARRLGIGGGYRSAAPEAAGAARRWHFRFGLCICEAEQVIPASQASELKTLLQTWCEGREFGFTGGFRAYTSAECGSDAD